MDYVVSSLTNQIIIDNIEQLSLLLYITINNITKPLLHHCKCNLYISFTGERGLDARTRPWPVWLHGRLLAQVHDRARPAGQALPARVHLQLSDLAESSGESRTHHLVNKPCVNLAKNLRGGWGLKKILTGGLNYLADFSWKCQFLVNEVKIFFKMPFFQKQI